MGILATPYGEWPRVTPVRGRPAGLPIEREFIGQMVPPARDAAGRRDCQLLALHRRRAASQWAAAGAVNSPYSTADRRQLPRSTTRPKTTDTRPPSCTPQIDPPTQA